MTFSSVGTLGATYRRVGRRLLDRLVHRRQQLAGFEHSVWVGAVIVDALLVWVTSAIALRSGLLPKWFAWLGVLAGILQLFAIFFIPVFIFWGWILIVSMFLFIRSGSARTPAPPAVT
jgi:hypothetical protein